MEKLKTGKAHLANARNERRKSAHHRYKAREHNRFTAVPLVKIMRFSQRRAIQEAPPTNSSESPGRKGKTTSPVSQNTIRKSAGYTQAPYSRIKAPRNRSILSAIAARCSRLSTGVLSFKI